MPNREKFDLDLTLSRLPRPAQHQGSLQEQMIELRTLAAHFGLYDADNWLQDNFFFPAKPDAKAKAWEEVAVYFADCEAATAYTFGSTKSLSKYETGRHASICTSLAESLTHGVLINKRTSDRQKVIDRLNKSAALCHEKLEKK